MTDIQISSDWQQPASYIELYNVKSRRSTFDFTLFGKLMYLLKEVYFSIVITNLCNVNGKNKVMFEVGLIHSSLKKAEEDLKSIASLEELAIKLAMSSFPYSRDLALVALFCSVDTFKLGAQKPVVREWLYELSLQDPDAIAVAAQDQDLPKLVKLIHGKKLMTNSFLEQSSN